MAADEVVEAAKPAFVPVPITGPPKPDPPPSAAPTASAVFASPRFVPKIAEKYTVKLPSGSTPRSRAILAKIAEQKVASKGLAPVKFDLGPKEEAEEKTTTSNAVSPAAGGQRGGKSKAARGKARKGASADGASWRQAGKGRGGGRGGGNSARGSKHASTPGRGKKRNSRR